MEQDGSGIELVGPADIPPHAERWLADTLARCAVHLPVTIDRATIALVHDSRMQNLHERFSRDASTTDVLTFATNEPGAPIDCDIAICVDEARRRAVQFGHPMERELLLYALHGLLHACGHDDRDSAAHAAMHAEEDRILIAAGVGATFVPGGGPAPGAPAPDARGGGA